MKRMAKPNMPAPASEQGRPASLHELVTTPAAQNTAALEPWTVFGDCDLAKMAAELREQTRQVTQAGDMQAPEAMLYGQAVALQTIFTSLSRRAALNVGEYMDATERYLRLALKAQAQCRATLETLAEMKNPRPVAFVHQANIANGPQQVNNGASSTPGTAVVMGGGESSGDPKPVTGCTRTRRVFSPASAEISTPPATPSRTRAGSAKSGRTN